MINKILKSKLLGKVLTKMGLSEGDIDDNADLIDEMLGVISSEEPDNQDGIKELLEGVAVSLRSGKVPKNQDEFNTMFFGELKDLTYLFSEDIGTDPYDLSLADDVDKLVEELLTSEEWSLATKKDQLKRLDKRIMRYYARRKP